MGNPETFASEVRRIFLAAAESRGHQWATMRSEASGEYGDCWTHAWNATLETPTLEYCEGIVRLPSGGYGAHAWALQRGGTLVTTDVVVEATQGYEGALEYRGFILNRSHPWVAECDRIFLASGSPRSSVLETILGSGKVTMADIVAAGVAL